MNPIHVGQLRAGISERASAPWYFYGLAALMMLAGDGLAQSKQAEIPDDANQLSVAAEWFIAGEDEFGSPIEYHGQDAQNGNIVLTASNGFFDRGLRAGGKSNTKDKANGHPDGKNAKGHPPLIAHDYAYLDGWDQPGESMRWHLYFTRTGTVRFLIVLDPNSANETGAIDVSFAGQKKRILVNNSDAMKKGLEFRVSAPGKQTLKMTAETASGNRLGRLLSIDVDGPAVEKAKLLRARWRPAAVHGRYLSSKTDDTTMWVMVSKNMGQTSSYSPIVTPFGYYGGSFGADQRFQGSFNFSMWSNENAPVEQQAHLLALGDPSLQFSGFGHEGTGVKPRGWAPLEDSKPFEVVQSLRVERGQKYNTYYGYFFDPSLDAWKLYAVGRKWVGGKSARKSKSSLWPGSFVEVPGPPQVQRSGDQVRKVVRKGWCLDAQGDWQRLDILPAGKRKHSNKSWGVNKGGWFVFQMGGMEHFSGPARDIRLPDRFVNEPLPRFLSPEKVKQLYQLPVMYGEQRAVAGVDTASLNLSFSEVGSQASAMVYYGTKDCLTFAPRKKSGTEKKHSTLKQDHIWQHVKKVEVLKSGSNLVELTDLKPGTQYYYRTLVLNEYGKMWAFESGSFRTSAK